MQIIGMAHVVSTDEYNFYKMLTEKVVEFQGDGQEIEIQYSSNISKNHESNALYSALILGRK